MLLDRALNSYLVGDLEKVEARLLSLPQVDIPVAHHFAPGIYMREAVMPAGAFVIGHAHKEEGFNIVLTGRALVKIDGEVREIKAPCIIKSAAGTRKVAYVIEEMRWINVHPTTETDLAVLEDTLIDKSTTFQNHEKTLQEMTAKAINAGGEN